MLDQELQKIGLSEKEAKVYLAALELGQAPVQKISQKAGVNRATTYVILEGLQKKGVISTVDQGKKRLFVAEGPHALHNIISEQQEALKHRSSRLEEILPQLQSLFNLHPNKPVVRFYEGKEGLKTILEERLIDKPQEVNVFFSREDVTEVFSEEEMKDYRDKRSNLGIYYKGVCSVKSMDEELPFSGGEWQKVLQKDYPFKSDIAVYNEKVSISILKGDVSGVVIESKAVAETFRSIFKIISDCIKKNEQTKSRH